jgi:hypothetical protein
MRAWVLIVFGMSFPLVFQSPASARPVTLKDLVGRKICWDYGNISTFGARGKYYSPLVGEGIWSLTGSGVQLNTTGFTGIMDVDKQPDGTFQSRLEKGAGKYCK